MDREKIVHHLPAAEAESATYSPVVEISCSKLVIVSGQVADSDDEDVVGDDIIVQTHQALENCRRQLATAGCTLGDVFKVTIYMKDLGEWEKLNRIYTEVMPAPRPARATVQAGLLPGYLVEIEMWAAK